jgi:hypothetical protein
VPLAVLLLPGLAVSVREVVGESMELAPGPGMTWYFFTEVFKLAQPYFRLVFAAQPFLYLLPLTVRLGGDLPLLVSGPRHCHGTPTE